MVTAIEETETFHDCETRYAWISDLPSINAGNIRALTSATGRMRHTIEDQFNTEKNNGIGMEHVFCANATASKNLYTLMQIAYMLWTLFYHGYSDASVPGRKHGRKSPLPSTCLKG